MEANWLIIIAVSSATAAKVIAAMGSVFTILQVAKKVFPNLAGWYAFALNVTLSVIGAVVSVPPESLFSVQTFTTLMVAVITAAGAAGFHGTWKNLGPSS